MRDAGPAAVLACGGQAAFGQSARNWPPCGGPPRCTYGACRSPSVRKMRAVRGEPAAAAPARITTRAAVHRRTSGGALPIRFLPVSANTEYRTPSAAFLPLRRRDRRVDGRYGLVVIAQDFARKRSA